jgi:hypothetical protein
VYVCIGGYRAGAGMEVWVHSSGTCMPLPDSLRPVYFHGSGWWVHKLVALGLEQPVDL